MKERLLDLSGKVDDLPLLVEVCESISSIAGSLDIPFFVVGATARNLIFERGYGVKSTRATEDIDFGVHLSDWSQYHSLTEGMISTGDFTDTRQKQRLIYKGNLKIDIVPFGLIKDDNHDISWPPEQDFKMNILGFEEAYEHSLPVKLRGDSESTIPFASPTGLAILKIIAWDDRTVDLRNRDAKDISYIMKNYLEAGNKEHLYNDAPDLFSEEDYDYELAGARLLGRDIACIVQRETKTAILRILESQIGEQEAYPLAEEMGEARTFGSNVFEENLKFLETLKQGIEDI